MDPTERLKKKQEAWEQTKAKGMWNFVLWSGGIKFTALFAFLFVVIWFILRMLGPAAGVVEFRLHVLYAIVGAPLAGIGFGLFMWPIMIRLNNWAKNKTPSRK